MYIAAATIPAIKAPIQENSTASMMTLIILPFPTYLLSRDVAQKLKTTAWLKGVGDLKSLWAALRFCESVAPWQHPDQGGHLTLGCWQALVKFELAVNLKTAGARPHSAAVAACYRRRGDRVKKLFAAVHESAIGRAPRRRESPVEEESTRRVVDWSGS
jgi:hypothetical protein